MAAPLATAFLAAFCAIAAAAELREPGPGAQPAQAGPRYVSLKTEGANGRRGPGVDQKVDWIYEEAGLPLLVTGQSGPWRRVQDPDGAQVWMHASNLDNRRTVYVSADQDVALKSQPGDKGRTLAHLAHGVVGALTGCEGDWRRIAVGDHAGWAPRAALWGADNCAGL